MTFEINDKVISTRFGIGRITGIEKVGPTEQTFFSIAVTATNAKILVPQKDLSSIRKLSEKTELESALSELGKIYPWPKFASKKDRVLYFKEEISKQALLDRVKNLTHLWNLEDKGKVEVSILSSLKDILAKEIEAVYEVSIDEANQMIESKHAA